MAGFTKLFESILDSTIWGESKETRLVWVTMLAMANMDGIVDASVPGLASRAKVTVEECETAIEVFMSPDKWSRSKEHEGRRIRVVDGGWELLNHAKYRDKMSKEEIQQKNRERQAKWRAAHPKPLKVSGKNKSSAAARSSFLAGESLIAAAKARGDSPEEIAALEDHIEQERQKNKTA